MSYHEQITTCHPDYADVRERLHDVIKSGGREGVNIGGRVLRNAPMDNLEKKKNHNFKPQSRECNHMIFSICIGKSICMCQIKDTSCD